MQADREQRVLCQLFFSRERYVGDCIRMFISVCFGVCQVDSWPKMLNIGKEKVSSTVLLAMYSSW